MRMIDFQDKVEELDHLVKVNDQFLNAYEWNTRNHWDIMKGKIHKS